MSDLDYLRRLHRNPSPLLLELEQHGRADRIPIVDRETGRLLSTLVSAMQANRILEIGTAYGYSTLWMALAMPPAGKIWDDRSGHRANRDRARFSRTSRKSGVGQRDQSAGARGLAHLPGPEPRHRVHRRDQDRVRSLPGPRRPAAQALRARHRRQPAMERRERGRAARWRFAETRALRDFNRTFLNHPQLDATIVPVGDGVGIGARTE